MGLEVQSSILSHVGSINVRKNLFSPLLVVERMTEKDKVRAHIEKLKKRMKELAPTMNSSRSTQVW